MKMLPVFDLESSSTRDKIITVVASDPGISTKKINHILKKQYALNVTYQAVHKTLKQMLDQGILVYRNKSYYINKDWLELLKNFLNFLEKKETLKDKRIIHNEGKEIETIEVNTLSEAENLFFQFREEFFNNIEKYPIKDRVLCYHSPHQYIALMSPAKEYEFMDRLLNNKTRLYALCKGNTVVDRWIERFYNSKKGNPYRIKIGANCSSLNEVWLYPDKLIELFFSEKFWKFYDDLYKGVKKIGDINYSHIIEKLRTLENEPFKIIIHKNKSLIRLAKEETLQQFDDINIAKPIIVPVKKEEKKSQNILRFDEMDETYALYNGFYKEFIKEIIKENPEYANILNDYVINRLGSSPGIRAYLMRKYLEIFGIDWKEYLPLISYVELHTSSMYCYNVGRDKKTSINATQEIFYKISDIIKGRLFDEVKNKYGEEVHKIFLDTDDKFYIAQVLDTAIDNISHLNVDSNKLKKSLITDKHLNVRKEIIDEVFSRYESDSSIELRVYERTYYLTAYMVKNFVEIAHKLSMNKDINLKKSLIEYSEYWGLSNMILNDIQDFSLDLIDTKYATREKEKIDAFADTRNGYVTWVISYGLKNQSIKEKVLEQLLLKTNKLEELVKLRELFISEKIFLKSYLDAISYGIFGMNSLSKISKQKHHINMLRITLITPLKVNRFIRLIELEYGIRIRVKHSKYNLLKKVIAKDPKVILDKLKQREFSSEFIE